MSSQPTVQLEYIKNVAQWKDGSFWRVLTLPLSAAGDLSSALEKTKHTPKRTPFRPTENNFRLDLSFTESPVTKVIESPRIRERISQEVLRQVKQEKEKYFAEMSAEYDRLMQKLSNAENESENLRKENLE